MSNVVGTLHQILWGSSYTLPPDGAPRVLAEWFTPGHTSVVPDAILKFPHSLGGGYGLAVTHFSPPAVRKPPEKLAVIRQKALRRRMERKAPLFAEQFITETMAAKPGYFRGEPVNPDVEQARVAADEAYTARLAYYQAHPNQLLVYGQEPLACREVAARLRAEVEASMARAAERRKQHAADDSGCNSHKPNESEGTP